MVAASPCKVAPCTLNIIYKNLILEIVMPIWKTKDGYGFGKEGCDLRDGIGLGKNEGCNI